MKSELMMTVDEVAKQMNVSGPTVRRWIARGQLRAFSPRFKHAYRVKPSDLELFIEENSSKL